MRVEKSFLKWVGGKGRIIPQLLPHLPTGRRLIEPFVGGGSVFINTNYDSYLLADSNRDLIDVYLWLRTSPARLIKETRELFNSKPDFNDVRLQFNCTLSSFTIERAAQFLYLNRHCFNGICRYNKKGEFNTPRGKYKSVYFPESELIAFSNKLNRQSISIRDDDFEDTIATAGDGDVIYCDPPYVSGAQNNIFTGYTSRGFDCQSTELLEISLTDAVSRGATAVVSSSNNSFVKHIFRDFKIHEIDAPRSVAANGNRSPAREIIAVLTPDMI